MWILFFKQKTAYELRISDWSSDVCSSDLAMVRGGRNRDPKIAANWTISELFGALNKAGLDLADSPVSAAALGGLIELIGDGTISGRIAKDVFAELLATSTAAAAIVAEKGLRPLSDSGPPEAVVAPGHAANP